MKTWIIAAILGIALSLAAVSGAFAQAGSTGGTIGKPDKSFTGAKEQSEPSGHLQSARQKHVRRKPTPAQPAARSVEGVGNESPRDSGGDAGSCGLASDARSVAICH